MKLAACAAVLFGFLGSTQEDKTIQQALKKFQDDFYRLGAKDDEKIAAINGLTGFRHEKVVKTLGPLMAESSIPVRIMAARALGQFQGVDGTSKELLAGLRSRANSGKKQTAVRIEVVRALGSLKIQEAAPDIDRLIEDKEPWVAKAAIDAAGKLRVKSSVEPLIKQLRRLEGPEGNGDVSINPLMDAFSEINGWRDQIRQDTRKATEREFLRDPILIALRTLTRQNHAAAKEWEAWWSKSKTAFKVPD